MPELLNWDVSGSDLADLDPANFDFIPNFGFRYIGDGRTVIISALSITKAGHSFTDEQLIQYARLVQKLFDSLRELPTDTYLPTRIFTDLDFRTYDSGYAYKFCTNETYRRYISQDSFLLSSLERYREMEHQGEPAGDRFEGSSCCAYTIADRELTVLTLSGFDTHIYSLARNLRNAGLMRKKFGPVVLRVRLRPFAQALAKALARTGGGSAKAETRLVRYADLKIHRGQLSLRDVEGFLPELTPRVAKVLRSHGRLPSIFAKPSRFEDEREVRIAIAAAQDVANCTVIKGCGLLEYFERID